MRLELLAFALLVLGPPLVASAGRSTFFLDRFARAWPAALLASVPGLAWLSWASLTGRLLFSPAHSFASPGGLAPEALVVVPAVAFACLFLWWVGFAGGDRPVRETPPPRAGMSLYALPLVALGLGIRALAEGSILGGLGLLGLGLLGPLDLLLRTRLIPRPRFWAFLGLVAVASVVFGGALIQRGVVSHEPSAVSGFTLIGLPIEDLGFALSLAGAAVVVFETLELRAAAKPRKGLIARFIEGRFGGYRHVLAPIDESLPTRLPPDAPRKPRVAIVGAGLAGMGAAAKLGERGFAVTLFERNDYLGGKLGAWKTTLPDGQEIGMSHGFHAFFGHYYNLNAFLDEIGVSANYKSVGDYLILTVSGRSYSFKDISTTPVLNLLSLARHGIYSLREVAGRETGPKMEAMLRYDPEATYAEWDEVSYAQFAADARLPDSLKLVFNTFARAFFSDPEKMSMAELIKSFHFYYLSNDAGLIYDYLDDDFDRVLLAPLRAHMEGHGVEIHTGAEISELVRRDDGRFEVRVNPSEAAAAADSEPFDHLIVASDVVGTRALFEASPSLRAAAPETAAKVATLTPGQRYSVLRVWIDRDIERELPGFIITERVEILDAVTFVHKTEAESAAWVADRAAAGLGGAVIELHCYALPDDMSGDEAELSAAFMAEIEQFFPELVGAELIHSYIYIRRDFPGFHVGKHATRPSWDTQLDNLFLAGDWVVLPFPAMLMEAAYSAGLLAANAISRAESVREEPVFRVPLRGLMAGWAKRPL